MANILVISKYYYPFSGGIEENVRAVSEYAARKHAVTVIANNHENGNKEETINGVKIIRRHVDMVFKSQPISMNFFSGIKIDNYDVVHFHSPNPLVTLQFLSRALFSKRVPVVVTHHMDIFGRKLLRALSIPMIRSMVRNARYTIVTSQKNRKISADLPATGNYVAIPLAIVPEDYVIDDSLKAEASAFRERLCGNAPVVGFIGRHARYKGLHVLMRALREMPEVHAIIAGDGPYRSSIEKLAHDLGMENRIHFLGKVSHRDKLKVLTALDVFVFPSTEITEAFGISQMEAMMCGAPVVASNLPTGVTDVSIDGETAVLFEPGSIASLQEKLSYILENKKYAGELAERARQHILKNMTNEIVSKQTVDLLEAAISSTGSP